MRRTLSVLVLASTMAIVAPAFAQDAVRMTVQGASQTSLSTSPSSVDRGTILSFNADVQPRQGGPSPTGDVKFYFGNYLLGTATIKNTVATLKFDSSYLAVGSYTITAHYEGDSYYQGSTSTGSTFTVSGITNSKTSLAVSPSSVVAGYPVTLTADIQPLQGGPNAKGTVLFFAGFEYLGAAPVANTVASIQVGTAGAPAGTYGIFAFYLGDAKYNSSISPIVNVKVTN